VIRGVGAHHVLLDGQKPASAAPDVRRLAAPPGVKKSRFSGSRVICGVGASLAKLDGRKPVFASQVLRRLAAHHGMKKSRFSRAG